MQSSIRYMIDAQFRENNVTIPFPQRDLHLRSSKLPLQLSIEANHLNDDETS